jgi:hypothetical protein
MRTSVRDSEAKQLEAAGRRMTCRGVVESTDLAIVANTKEGR